MKHRALSKLLDVFRVSYVTHVVHPIVDRDVIRGCETYIVNRFYYIPGRIRESCGCPSDIDARRWRSRTRFGAHESKRGHFRTKMARIPRRNDGKYVTRERCANRQISPLNPLPPLTHIHRVPWLLTNIFKPRVNQVFDQVRQTSDRSNSLLCNESA